MILKRFMYLDEIRYKFPIFFESLLEIGYDNNLLVKLEKKVKLKHKKLERIESFLKELKINTCESIANIYNIPHSVLDEPKENALIVFCCGEQTFAFCICEKNKAGKQAHYLLNEFFDGKYSYTYGYR